MTINRQFIGREYPFSADYEVSGELIRRFAAAIGDLHPAYLDRRVAAALGYRDVIAPPTFLTLLTFRFADESPMRDPDLQLDYLLVVHGEQRFLHHRPVIAGDRLQAILRVIDIRDAGRNELMTMKTVVTDDAGQPVADLLNTVVSRGTASGQVGRPVGAVPSEALGSTLLEGQGEAVHTSIGYDDVEVGTALAAKPFAADRAQLVRYAGASGDFNVIHWSERAARSAGLPNVIAHGMFTMAQLGRIVSDWAGNPAAVVDYGVRFAAPVPVPDDDLGTTVHTSGVVAEKLPGRRVAVDLEARVGETRVLSNARAVVRLA